jgi:DNA repair exonuclease SbcCD ATPase subunit
MIIFEKVRWKNFLSTGKEFTEFTLNDHKTTLVVGHNGAGKSTLLDALSFVLYGKAYRDLTQAQILNSINKKNLLVECELSVHNTQYLIRRGLKPKVFEVYRNGTLIDQSSSERDYQTIITEDILKIDQKSFTQIVTLGSANYIPFMKLPTPVRRKVIEDILDLSIFSVMNELLKEQIKLNKENISELDNKLSLTKSKIEINRKHIESVKESNEEMIAAKQEKISFYEEKNNALLADSEVNKKEIQTLQDSLDALGNKLDKFSGLDDANSRLQLQKEKLKKEIRFFEETTICPTCSQTIDDDFRNECIHNKMDKLKGKETAIEDIQELLLTERKLSEKYNNLHMAVTSLNKSISDANFSVSQNNRFIKDLQEEINLVRTKNKAIEINDDSILLTEELSNLLKEKENLIEDREVYGVAAQLLKDGGIKALIIKQYIPEINKIVNDYLQALDFFVQFELNENFEETIKSRYRDEFSYENFSEGEKDRIDLSLLFTWREIAKLRNSISTNLLIMDEVFDGSLDSGGTDDLLKILNVLTKDSNVVIISHKTDQLLDKFDRVVSFKKLKNFSIMETM